MNVIERGTPQGMQTTAGPPSAAAAPASALPTPATADRKAKLRPLLPQVSAPTIVFHSDRDRIAPVEEGQIVAAEIPGARFVPLSSANHLLLAEEPAWKVFREELASFLR